MTDSEISCPICLDTLENIETPSSLQTLPCQHHFHETCIKQWHNNTCPVCRSVIIPLPPPPPPPPSQSCPLSILCGVVLFSLVVEIGFGVEENSYRYGLLVIWLLVICGNIRFASTKVAKLTIIFFVLWLVVWLARLFVIYIASHLAITLLRTLGFNTSLHLT